MSLCVNINSKEFKDTAKRLDISEASLENIVHEYMNTEGNETSFPSDSYILSKTEGQPFTEPLSEKAQKLIDKKYSRPITVDTYEDAQAVMNDMAQYFDPQHIGLKETLSGKYQVSLGNTETAREMFTIKSEAEKNGTFMKAPNGEPTNLTEKQWLQVRTKAFKDWFGDWENDPASASKVVDENGEPLVVYHGGAPKISTFRVGNPETTTTGYGTYTEEGTGREIPVDSARTIFFSSNPFVGQSYAQLYALQYFKDLRHKVQNMIGNLHDDVAGFSRDDFKSFDEFYDFLTIISEYNPRFAKLRDYIKGLQQKGERLKPNEIAAARQLFKDLRSVLREYTEDWNLVSSEWDNILTIGKNIINEYLGGEYHAQNVQRLLNGEIPAYLKKEWELFIKIRNHREKYGLPQIGNYDEVQVWLSSGQSFTGSDYILKYDGKELIFDETRGKRDVPISQMSFDEVSQFLQMARHANQYSFWERDDDRVKQAFREKSGYYPVFLNMRNPFEHDYEGTHMGQGYKQSPKTSFGYVAARQVDKAIRDGNDGVVYRNIYDPYLADNYGVFNPNQIKSATDNSGAFSRESSNIYQNRDTEERFDLLDYISGKRIYGETRRGEILSKLNGKYYLPKGTSRQALENFRIEHGLPEDIFSLKENANSIEVTINEDVVKDAIARNEKNVSFDQLFSDNAEANRVRRVLDFLSAKTGIKYEVISEDRAKELIKNIENVNAFIKGDTAYFIDGRKLNTDIASEEMLHPLVASIKNLNKAAFDSLLNDARRAYPRLRLEIAKSYDKENIAEELVTQALARAFREDITANPHGNKVVSLLRNFIDRVVAIFKSSFGEGESITHYFRRSEEILQQGIFNATDLADSITISDLAKIINSELNISGVSNIDRVAFNREEVSEDGLSIPTEEVRPELTEFQDRTTKMVTQLNNLLDSGLVTKSEVRHIAEQAVYFISDSITEFMENPSKIFDTFANTLGIREGRPITEEEKNSEIEKIKGMSRAELASYITPEQLINLAKNRLFTSAGNSAINTRALGKKANLIFNNFVGVLRFAEDAFNTVEKFSITYEGERLGVKENTNTELKPEENYDTEEEVNTDDTLENWQIENRTQDIMSSMSDLVRQALNKCFQIRVNPETGAKEKVPSEFGIAERINAKDATASILRWTRGAESLSHMLQMLEAKAKENPWIEQVTERLKDQTGKEADFQSQFYGVFAKAFQPYSIVLKERNEKTGAVEYKSIQVNQHPALTDATQSVEVAFKTNTHPMFDTGKIKKDVLDTYRAIVDDLVNRAKSPLEENNIGELVDLISKASAALGYTVDLGTVYLALDSSETFNKMVNNLKAIGDKLTKALGQENYNPFKFGGENSISGYLKSFLQPLTDKLEDTAVSSFYDSGKMYQSYVTPSYLTVLMTHLTSDDARFQQYIQSEYGAYGWFKTPNGEWRNKWLEILDGMSQEDRKNLLKHKVQLNFNKHNYMKNMSDVEYALSIFSEYFSEYANAKGTTVPVWYRIPMMSNKPSSEFIRMYAYTGKLMEGRLAEEFSKIFQQELSRIQAVDIRAYDKSNPNFIKNFDKNGKKFMMLDFFNKYLKGNASANSELGVFINRAIEKGTESFSAEENNRFAQLVNQEIIASMNAKADTIIAEWKASGVFEGAKQIANIGTDDATVEAKLREFIWNDTFASMNILELTITDPAFYKDAEDLQKRLAQIHAPGIRANVEAIDYEGNRVSSDGKFRTMLLKDFDYFISNIKDNLRIVFDRKLEELKKTGLTEDSANYKAAVATYNNIIDQFNNINVADAQGYSSPTSYRKKAFIFGRWSRSAEDIYKKLLNNEYTYTDLQTAFQPLKPFVYGQIEKPGIESARSDVPTPLSTLKVPVQFKNSEYLLIMADAILQNEDTGKPNLLRAIYQVMEDSAYDGRERDASGRVTKQGVYNGRGIDTIQFESTCKSGLQGAIDINQYYDVENGEALAKQALEEAIEKEYVSRVYEVPFENYAIQQEVPEHFKNHFQAHGSQIRYIIPSDLETVDSEGNPVTYDYFDRGEQKKLSAEDFKAEYENNIAENIQESLNTLRADLGIDNAFLSKKDRNIALSKVLLEEILSSPRYGVELAVACTVNSETGEFNIPLGDPIQSKRIEQLINSVIKNRINKQEIAGGPVVQVSNFGTSRQLNIVFKDKRGGLLMTRAEFEKSGREGTFEDYIRENQAGISHYEVFAPIYANELFNKFADKEGNIDIETIEKINPDLLKMIGYRIPTEDKYSMAPLKIVGFLPREAGDGIMLPNDITLLTGSDFDIDKFYLMRKEVNITHRFLGDVSNIAEDSPFYEKNKTSIRKELLKRLEYTYEKIKLSDAAKGRVEERAALLEEEAIKSLKEKKEQKHNTYMLRAEALERNKNERLEPIRKAYDRDVDALEASFKNNEITEEEYNSRMDELDDAFTKDTERIESKYQRSLDRLGKEPSTELTEWERAEISEEKQTNMYELARAAQRRLLRDAIDSFLDNPFAKPKDALERKIKDAYIKYMFDFAEPTEGTTYRNNKIVDMSWAVLTNETTASKMLTPGGFEPEKRMGYLVSAYQNPAVNMTWEQLNAIDNIDDLKALCYTDKNLCFIDTHLQFYKQNSAAATALGMAAVQKVAHAVLEGDGFMLDVSKALDFADDEYFTIAGKKFIGRMELDRKFNDNGELIGRTLGEFVAMFADAVKDPVANLMNINNTTMPMVTTLIRLGLPFKQVALFVSQPVIKEVLDLYNSKNITTFTRLSDVIQERIDKIVKDYSLEEESRINEFNEVTEEELIENLNPEVRADAAEESAVADYKILRFFQYITKLSSAIKGTTYATRLNSISSAVGPLIIDNLIMEYKMNQSDFSNIFDETGTEVSFGSILQRHPILSRFSEALDIATDLFSEMPINSQNFRDMVFSADVADDLKSIIFGDRKILNELSDFYKSYLLIASNTVPVNATAENKYQGIKYYVEQFPQDFMRGKAKERYKGNSLIDAIRVDVQRGRTVLKIDTTGMTTQDKEKLGDGWEDLYFRTDEGGRKLAEHLFYYNFWRAGIGFSPKSFMGLFPTRLKSQIAGYNEAFTVHSLNYASNVVGKYVVEQFIRNNADNNKLVPRTSIGKNGASLVKTEDGKTLFVFRGENYEKIKNNPYLKVKQGNNIVILKRELTNREGKEATYTTLELLGNNGEYFEAYTGTEYTPLTTTETTTEASKESQLQEVSGITEDVPEQTQPTDREKFKRATYIKDQLLQAFKLKGLSEEASKQKVEGFDKKSAEERAKLASSVEEFVGKVFEEHNIPFDKDEFEEAYKEFC